MTHHAYFEVGIIAFKNNTSFETLKGERLKLMETSLLKRREYAS